jgi:hypothetical protein
MDALGTSGQPGVPVEILPVILLWRGSSVSSCPGFRRLPERPTDSCRATFPTEISTGS